MKRNNFILLTLVIVILGVWPGWFFRKPAQTQDKVVKTTTAKPTEGSNPMVPVKVATPIMAPVPTPKSTSSATTPAAEPADPQANLKTAVLDIGRLIRDGGDPEAFREAYTPPNELTAELIEKIRRGIQRRVDMGFENPIFPKINQEVVNEIAGDYESLENQTPTYNDAGNEATYTWTHYYPDGATYERSKTFVKINGKWYMKLGDAYSE